MELRNKEKGGFTDEIIFSSRVSASLLDVDDEEAEKDRLAKKSETTLHVVQRPIHCRSRKRRIQTGRRVLKRAGGLHSGGEIDGRAFFDLRLEHG